MEKNYNDLDLQFLKNNLIFTVEPNFSTLIGSAQRKDYAVKTRKYNYGINLNVNYVLKGGK